MLADEGADRRGLVRHWGVSNENAFGITMLCATCVRLGCPLPVSCQNDFSILNQTYEEDTYEAAYRFGLVGLPYGALCGGTLTGKYFEKTKPTYAAKDAEERPLEKCRHRVIAGFQPRYGERRAMQAAREVVELAEAWGITPQSFPGVGRKSVQRVGDHRHHHDAAGGRVRRRRASRFAGRARESRGRDSREVPQPVRVLRGQSGVASLRGKEGGGPRRVNDNKGVDDT